MKTPERRLQDLVSIGPATLSDFNLLGIHTVKQLARKDAKQMYRQLCQITGTRHDICCLDVFTAAVSQAKNPRLPMAQCQWWYWRRKRKAVPPDR